LPDEGVDLAHLLLIDDLLKRVLELGYLLVDDLGLEKVVKGILEVLALKQVDTLHQARVGLDLHLLVGIERVLCHIQQRLS
jgi:hypothetical protein